MISAHKTPQAPPHEAEKEIGKDHLKEDGDGESEDDQIDYDDDYQEEEEEDKQAVHDHQKDHNQRQQSPNHQETIRHLSERVNDLVDYVTEPDHHHRHHEDHHNEDYASDIADEPEQRHVTASNEQLARHQVTGYATNEERSRHHVTHQLTSAAIEPAVSTCLVLAALIFIQLFSVQ